MPTSKKRSGHFLWNRLVPVPDGIAAVIATSLGYSPASWVRASPNTLVHCGGPAWAGRNAPAIGAEGARARDFLGSGSGGGNPLPLSVIPRTTPGPRSVLT